MENIVDVSSRYKFRAGLSRPSIWLRAERSRVCRIRGWFQYTNRIPVREAYSGLCVRRGPSNRTIKEPYGNQTHKSTPIVEQFGLMWARNKKNPAILPKRREGGEGVYVLYDGSMPVYAGRGGFRNRINYATRSIKRAQMWDHFSWFSIKDRKKHHDLEMLMLQILLPPWVLTSALSADLCRIHFMGSGMRFTR